MPTFLAEEMKEYMDSLYGVSLKDIVDLNQVSVFHILNFPDTCVFGIKAFRADNGYAVGRNDHIVAG